MAALIGGTGLRPVKTHNLEAGATEKCRVGTAHLFFYFPSRVSTAGQLIFWKKAWM